MLIGSRGPVPSVGSIPIMSRMGLDPGPYVVPINGDASGGLPDLAGGKAAPGHGILDRIGSFLGSDEGRAALLRSGAATLSSGDIGAGITAGANYVDHRHAAEAAGAQQKVENQLAEQQQALRELTQQQANDLGWGGVDVNLRQLDETGRHNRAGENLAERGQNVEMRGQNVSRANNTENNVTSRANNAEDNSTSRSNNAATVGASIYGSNMGYLSSGVRAAAGIGSRGAGNGGYTTTRTVIPGQEAGLFGGEDTPGQTVTTRVPNVAPPPAAGANPPARQIPQQAIEALQGNPNLRPQFEAHYGAGTASQYLGGR